MRYKTLNLKDFMPTVPQALAIIELEIEMCKKEGVKVLKVIHGYGSHGVGGEIKKALPLWSKKALKKGFIKDFIKGESCNEQSERMEKLKKICPEILGDFELYFANAGISLILID